MLLAGLAAIGQAAPLRVLAWPGYADPDVVAAFEQKTGIKVDVTFIDTDDALWAKASANDGSNFDILAVNTGELQRYIDAYLVRDIPAADIPNIQTQLPRFQHVTDVERAGKRYAVPFTYSEMGLIFDKKQASTAPTSMSALWDPRYRGKIALYEGSNHNFSLTALSMGIQNPFELNPEQFRRVVHRLVDLRANRPLFYSSPEDAVDLFRKHEVALMFGNYGSQQVQLLKKAGFDVGYVIPKEGAIAWLDCWAILRGANDLTQATAWINYMTSPEVGRLLSQRQGLPNTQQRMPNIQDSDRIIWLQPVENNTLRNQYWSRILAGAKRGIF